MIISLDHLIFGNGHGLKAPFFDSKYFWLSGELYVFSYGLGAQLTSFQWTHPKPGERRVLLGREFKPFQSHRRWGRVEISWSMTRRIQDINELHNVIRDLQTELNAL